MAIKGPRTLQEQQRVENCGREKSLLQAGIPKIYHNLPTRKFDTVKLQKFIDLKVEGLNSGFLIMGDKPEYAYAVGSRLTEMALDQRIHTALIGFSSLLNVHKSSFREPAMKEFLRDIFTYRDIIVIANITDSAIRLWRDERDNEWFRRVIMQRSSYGKKTALCVCTDCVGDELDRFVGQDVTNWLHHADILQLKKDPYGEN